MKPVRNEYSFFGRAGNPYRPGEAAPNFTVKICASLFALAGTLILSSRLIAQDYNQRYYEPSKGYDSSAFSDEPPTERYRNESYSWYPDYDANGQYHQPTDMLRLGRNRFLICTRKTGLLFVFDAAARTAVLVEQTGGLWQEESSRSFSAMVALDEGRFAVAEDKSNKIIVFRLNDQESYTAAAELQLELHGGCGDLAYDRTSQTLWASGRWSKRLHAWRLASGAAHQNVGHVDLDINGGQLLLADGDSGRCVLIADAFGSRMQIVDSTELRVVKSHELYDHNFQSMRLTSDGKSVVMACQNLSELTPAVRGEITWGGMLSNNVRRMPLDNLLRRSGDEVYSRAEFYSVGFAGNGAGTPTDLIYSSDGSLVVAMGGSSQLAVRQPGEQDFKFHATGLQPVRLELTEDETQAIVLCSHSDSVTIVHIDGENDSEHVMLGKLRAPTLAELGEQKFHDSRLSHDGWISCGSCHIDGHTSGLLNDNLTDHSQGTAKRILSLLGSRATAPYSWFGEQEELESQVEHSIRSTMASDHPVAPDDVRAIAAYIRTLRPSPSVSAARGIPNAREGAGRKLFERLNCTACHSGSEHTSRDAYDVGLSDEDGVRLFNPPSLRGVSQREHALLHDGRARSLNELFTKYQHQLDQPLSTDELRKLLQYLRSL